VRTGISRESEWGREFDQFGHRLCVAIVSNFFENVSQTITRFFLAASFGILHSCKSSIQHKHYRIAAPLLGE
jgi:hypothetical protein